MGWRPSYSLVVKLGLCAGLFACLAACTSGVPPDPCQLSYAGQATLEPYGNRLLVPALINGQAVALMLDTGGEVSVVSAAHAGLLKLKPAAISSQTAPPSIVGLGGRRTAHVMFTDSIKIGNLEATRVPFLVPDQSPLRPANEDPDILGMNFLAGFDLDVDVLDRRVVFYKANQVCDVPHVLMPPPLYTAMDVFGVRQNRHIVMVRIRGLPFRALLDTGAPQSILFRDGAERLGLDAKVLAADPHAQLRGVGLDTLDAVRHLSDPIEVGGLTISQMRLDISPEVDPAVEVILGMDFISKVHLWISNSSREVVLQFPPKASWIR